LFKDLKRKRIKKIRLLSRKYRRIILEKKYRKEVKKVLLKIKHLQI